MAGVEDQEQWCKVQPDGSLRCLNAQPDILQGEELAPCCVVCPPYVSPRGPDRDPRGAFYLVGRWPDIRVDSSVWGFGPDLGLLQYTVRDATRRLMKFKCRAQPG